MRAGAFLLSPRLETAFGFDSNVLGGSPGRGSWLTSTRPSLLVGSTWSRHAFGAYFSLSDTRYFGAAAQNRTDGTVAVGGSIDIGRDRFTMAASHVVTHQDRTQIDALPSDRPVPVRVEDVRASYAAAFGRWTWTPNIQASRWHFGDTTILGAPASQAWRDRDVLSGGITARYELAPLRNLVFVARAVGQHYPHTSPGQPQSDSTSYQLLAGLDYDDNAVWRYRVLVGGETRHFASAAYRPHTALIAEAEVTWMPTGLTTLRGTLNRGIEDAAQEGVAGFTYTSARVTIDHEYLRDIILSASVGLRQAAFLRGGGRQFGWSAGFGATWLMSRWVRLLATYDIAAIHSIGLAGSDTVGDGLRSVAMLTLRLGL
jgi:hypothetical protein